MSHFEALIDPTDFGTVRRYLTSSKSSITNVLFVREPRSLATVAELLTKERPTEAHRALFARWIREGHLKVGVQDSRPPDGFGINCLVDLRTIPDHARCRVLFLPPYYLVQLRTPQPESRIAGADELDHR